MLNILKKSAYNTILTVGALLYVPSMLYKRVFYGKYKKNLSVRLGLKEQAFPPLQDRCVIWLHAVSLGEVMAASALLKLIKQNFPNATLVMTCVTETGYEAAQKLKPDLDDVFVLPIDFSWAIRKVISKLKPSLLILVEGEYWPNLIHETKAFGAKIAVVNAKMSKRSFRRFSLYKPFIKSMLDSIDLLCAQRKEDLDRLVSLGCDEKKTSITGNLKFDIPFNRGSEIDKHTLKDLLKVDNHYVITIASTHDKEEAMILKELTPLMKAHHHLKILLIPRHPERFKQVEKWLSKNFLYGSYSKASSLNSHAKVILIDTMGMVSKCYEISNLALIGGSFVPIGGHNILESIRLFVPTLYGPYMHSQEELSSLAEKYHVGFKVPLEKLRESIEVLIQRPFEDYQIRSSEFMQELQGASHRTLQAFKRNLLI